MSTFRFWLYRVGVYYVGTDHHRAIWSETWLAEEPPGSGSPLGALMTEVQGKFMYPFGAGDVPQYITARPFIETIWPLGGPRQNFVLTLPFSAHNLNPAAPEAAFRLQRVGADGSLGRVLMPITNDRWFTDVPRRRHVDVELLGPHLDAGLNAYRTHADFGYPPVRYTNVVFHRRTLTWSEVDHYSLQRSTCRVWERWRYFPPITHDPVSDRSWVPDEIE